MRGWLRVVACVAMLCFVASAMGQSVARMVTGMVVDRYAGTAVPYASAIYKGHHVSAAADATGSFTIERHEGWTLTVKAVGYRTTTVTIRTGTPDSLVIRMTPEVRRLDEVVVRSKTKSKYRRRDNPAVELMRRVVAAKKRSDLERHDFYQYTKYQKITLAVNDVSPEEILQAQEHNQAWLVNQVEACPLNNKLILPISVDETVTRHVYRKKPRKVRDIVVGQNSRGVNQLFETGDILNKMLKDVFTDVDLYDDQIRLLQFPFTSPIGKDAVDFYRFYIEDTVMVDSQLCYHLQFLPNNPQDFGFRGELYILADSTLHVRKCNLSIPQRSDVNFVENMRIQQEYRQLDNGEWVLTTDDMMVELALTKFLSKAVVVRTTALHGYDFGPIDKDVFRGKASQTVEADARLRDSQFWQTQRKGPLTKSEDGMERFIDDLRHVKGYRAFAFGAKALIENFIETGTDSCKSRFDIGPVNTIVSRNFVDGLRFRASGQTTAALNPHFFWKGYYAHGRDSEKHYYSSQLSYSFNRKNYQPTEFPMRAISFTSAYDVMSPSDKFLYTDKDNVFTAFKWKEARQMYFYNRQSLKFDWETEYGLHAFAEAKREAVEPTGSLAFTRLGDGSRVGRVVTTEASVGLTYCPGRTYINTKQHRLPINFDAPEFSVMHTMGFDGLLGGQYRYNYTEVSVYRRLWLNSWGRLNMRFKLGAQWNKVPFPLLVMPPANLSYVFEDGTFALMDNMEFLNDRYAYADISWDINGKLFNRIPLLRRLKWREVIGVKAMMGALTDKNNPFVEANADSDFLFAFPENTRLLDGARPYWEWHVGIHNILKFFEIDYVRRMGYNNFPGVRKDGIRFTFEFSF